MVRDSFDEGSLRERVGLPVQAMLHREHSLQSFVFSGDVLMLTKVVAKSDRPDP